MAMIERDVIIAGAGPAGAICAAYLAKAGVDVLLIDKDIFPRDKACGDMVCEGIVSHLEKLEAVEAADAMSACLRSLKLISGEDKETVIPFECYCTPRYELDKLLVDTAAGWGAEIRQGCRVLDVVRERGAVKGVKVRYGGEEAILRSKLVIGADGANSAVAKALGIMEEKSDGMWLAQRAYFKGVKLDRAISRDQYDTYGVFGFDRQMTPGYFWVLPVGKDGVRRGICNVGMVIRDRDRYRGPLLEERFGTWVKKSEKISAMFSGAEQISPWKGGKLTDITQGTKKAGNGFILIGDAASLMIPLFNDGLSAAADSAKAAADTAVAALRRNDFSEKLLLNGYEAALENQCGRMKRPFAAETRTDEMKQLKLMIESMNDYRVMNKVIAELQEDPGYRKKILGRAAANK